MWTVLWSISKVYCVGKTLQLRTLQLVLFTTINWVCAYYNMRHWDSINNIINTTLVAYLAKMTLFRHEDDTYKSVWLKLLLILSNLLIGTTVILNCWFNPPNGGICFWTISITQIFLYGKFSMIKHLQFIKSMKVVSYTAFL